MVVIGLALALALSACSDDDPGDAAADPDELLPLMYGGSTPLVWPHAWIADNLDMWEEYGLEGSTEQFALGTESLQAMLAGATDLATLTPLPTLTAAAGGEPVRMFGCTTKWSEWRLVVRDDAGVETVADMPGKSVGVPVGTNMEFVLRHFFDTSGVDASEVEFVNIGPPDFPSAIQTGSVDAVWGAPPAIVNAESVLEGASSRVPFDFEAVYCFVTTEEILEEKRETFRRMLTLFADIDDMLVTDREEMAELLAEVAQAQTSVVEQLWAEEFEFETRPPGPEVLTEMELYEPYLKETGSIPADVELDFDELIVDIWP